MCFNNWFFFGYRLLNLRLFGRFFNRLCFSNWFSNWFNNLLRLFFYLFYKRQNLIAAMFHGQKPAHVVSETEAISGSQLLKALILAAIVSAAVWYVVTSAPPPAEMYY